MLIKKCLHLVNLVLAQIEVHIIQWTDDIFCTLEMQDNKQFTQIKKPRTDMYLKSPILCYSFDYHNFYALFEKKGADGCRSLARPDVDC